MDTAIVGGDFARDSRGRPVTLTGAAELLQRALIRLTVRRGSFGYDPGLGSLLHTLHGKPAHDRVLELVKEALRELPQVTVRRAELRQAAQRLELTLLLEAGGEQREVEVPV